MKSPKKRANIKKTIQELKQVTEQLKKTKKFLFKTSNQTSFLPDPIQRCKNTWSASHLRKSWRARKKWRMMKIILLLKVLADSRKMRWSFSRWNKSANNRRLIRWLDLGKTSIYLVYLSKNGLVKVTIRKSLHILQQQCHQAEV